MVGIEVTAVEPSCPHPSSSTRWPAASISKLAAGMPREQIAVAFADEVDRAVVRIAESPTIGTEFRTHYRWVRLKRFPYLIYDREVGIDTVVVLAVAHKRRRLGYWLRRDKT